MTGFRILGSVAVDYSLARRLNASRSDRDAAVAPSELRLYVASAISRPSGPFCYGVATGEDDLSGVTFSCEPFCCG